MTSLKQEGKDQEEKKIVLTEKVKWSSEKKLKKEKKEKNKRKQTKPKEHTHITTHNTQHTTHTEFTQSSFAAQQIIFFSQADGVEQHSKK